MVLSPIVFSANSLVFYHLKIRISSVQMFHKNSHLSVKRSLFPSGYSDSTPPGWEYNCSQRKEIKVKIPICHKLSHDTPNRPQTCHARQPPFYLYGKNHTRHKIPVFYFVCLSSSTAFLPCNYSAENGKLS